jgi:hypothetical protein
MATNPTSRFGLPPVATRVLMVFALLLVFVVVGSALDPRESKAAARRFAPRAAPPQPAASAAADETTGGRPLGSLRGASYCVLITSGPDGPLYTVSSLDGNILASDLTQDEVWQNFPGLDIDRLTAESEATGIGEPVMYVDPDR